MTPKPKAIIDILFTVFLQYFDTVGLVF